MVKWTIVQRPKDQGGLGVGDLVLNNAALLFKWWWRFASEEGALWKRVIQSLYENHLGILIDAKNPSLNGPWRAIKKLAIEDNSVAQAFFQNLEVQLGEESKILFWKDIWLLDKPLMVTFPELFLISTQKQERISNMGWFEGMVCRWTLSWRRELRTEEQQKLMQLQNMLVKHHPRRNEQDRAQWGMSGNFSVKDLLEKANKISKERAEVDTLVCTVWRGIAPPKVELMLWLALLERLNTKSMLVKKTILQSQDNTCSFCAQ